MLSGVIGGDAVAPNHGVEASLRPGNDSFGGVIFDGFKIQTQRFFDFTSLVPRYVSLRMTSLKSQIKLTAR